MSPSTDPGMDLQGRGVSATLQLTFSLMMSPIVWDVMHHGTSSHSFGWVVLIGM